MASCAFSDTRRGAHACLCVELRCRQHSSRPAMCCRATGLLAALACLEPPTAAGKPPHQAFTFASAPRTELQQTSLRLARRTHVSVVIEPAGQCVRPVMNCGSDGYDFAAVTEADLTIAAFDVIGVTCQGSCTAPCVASASACAVDGEPYSLTGCNCATTPIPVPDLAPECTDSDDCKWYEACDDDDQTCEFWGFVHWCVFSSDVCVGLSSSIRRSPTLDPTTCRFQQRLGF